MSGEAPVRRRSKSAAARAGARLRRMLVRERQLWSDGKRRVAGVDEVGVGPLAGPVVAAAVAFPPEVKVSGIHDSKQLTATRREALAEEIRERAAAFAVARVEPAEIDRLNIYHATLEAMRRAVVALREPPDHVLVDARTIPEIPWPQEAIVKGDARCHAIAAASILAKTDRDRLMAEFDAEFPGYGFGEHKGYPTNAHRAAIRELGPCAIHRRSFTLLPHPSLFDPPAGG